MTAPLPWTCEHFAGSQWVVKDADGWPVGIINGQDNAELIVRCANAEAA